MDRFEICKQQVLLEAWMVIYMSIFWIFGVLIVGFIVSRLTKYMMSPYDNNPVEFYNTFVWLFVIFISVFVPIIAIPDAIKMIQNPDFYVYTYIDRGN